MNREQKNLYSLIKDLCLIPGLSGHETNVRKYIESHLKKQKLKYSSDILGNLVCTLDGNNQSPSLMIFAHMDQIGFIVKKIENDGMIKVERVGGVSEKSLPSTKVVVINDRSEKINGVIGNKSHHVTLPDEKYLVKSYRDLFFDFGFDSKTNVLNAGINIGSPITFEPNLNLLGKSKITGTSIDDRASCAIILDLIKGFLKIRKRPTIHLVFSVQEEFNLRGVLPITRKLCPEIAIQLDISIASDTNETADVGHVELNNGPCISMYSFHGRGTLNGLIPHPSLVKLISDSAKENKINLQKIVTNGLLTDSSYVQLENEGVACIDLGFPIRYSHTPNEVCDLKDLIELKKLLLASVKNIDGNFKLNRK